jgi:transposase-like protein
MLAMKPQLPKGFCCKSAVAIWYGDFVTKKRPALFRGRHFEDVVIVLCVRWYLRYSLSYRDLKEMMAERGLSLDHVTIWRWVQRYAPVLNQRIRRELRRPNRSWRVDETYVKIAGNWARAVDSTGETIEFMLSPKRDLIAAKLFLRLALSGGGPSPRVINVDGHPAYASAIAELKQSGELGGRCRCRTSPYMNNIIEQDHRFIKKRITAGLGFRSAEGAWRTIEGYETMHAIRKGQIRWLAKGDVVGQLQFIHALFGIAA